MPLPTKRFAYANRWRAYRARDTVGWIVSYVVDELAVFAEARRARPAHMRGANQQLRKRSFHGGAGVAIITPSSMVTCMSVVAINVCSQFRGQV